LTREIIFGGFFNSIMVTSFELSFGHLSILLWIPTHILTFSMHYYNDYARAGLSGDSLSVAGKAQIWSL